jgi:streptogramin lyase
VAFEDGRLWITYGFSSDPAHRVDVLDPANPVLTTAHIAVPDGSYPIAGGAGALWIVDPLGSTLTKYDPFSGSTKSVALTPDSGPSAIQVSPGSSTPSVWVASGRAPSVTRVDAAHPGRTAHSFGTGHGVPSALAVAPDGSVWIVSREGDSVIALSSTGTTRMQEVLGRRCDGPAGVAAAAGAVWVSCSGSRAVVRLDPSNGAILATLPTGGTPGPMTIDAKGAVWVAVRGS